MIRVAGIDPGATTAIVWLDVPLVAHRPRGASRPDVDGARLVDFAIVRPTTAKASSVAERKVSLYERVRDAFVARPGTALVALEEPYDTGAGVWRNQTRRMAGQQGRTTLFLLGEHYGLALAGVRAACPAAAIASYPVNDYDRRPGWMQAGAARPQSRDRTLENLAHLARAMGAPCELLASEDALMALGVLRYHLAWHGAGAASVPAA